MKIVEEELLMPAARSASQQSMSASTRRKIGRTTAVRYHVELVGRDPRLDLLATKAIS